MGVKWRENTTAFAYGSPSLSNDGKLVLFPPSGDRRAWARHAATGLTQWSHEIGEGRSDVSTQGAVSKDGAAFYFLGEFNSGNGQDALYSYSVSTGESLFSTQWPAAQGRNMGDGGAPAALVLDESGSIWWVGSRGNLTAIDTASGNITVNVPNVVQNGRAGPGGCNLVAIARDGLA